MFYLIRVGKYPLEWAVSALGKIVRTNLSFSPKLGFFEKNPNFGEKDRFFVSLFFAEWGVSGEMLVLGIPGNDSHQLSVYRAGEFIFGLSLSYRFDVLIVGCQSSLTKITRKRQDFFTYLLKYRIF